MKHRAGVFVLAAVVSSTGPALVAQSVQTLTLQEAEQRALREHPQIRAAQYSAQAADQTVRQARSAFFPTVSASITGAQAESGTRIAAGGLNNPIILDRVATGLSFGQLITDFGRTSALAQSFDLRADAQRETADARRADVLLQVNRAYFGALRARAIERVAQDTVDTRQVIVDQVTALASSGLRSGLDLSFARVNLAEAQLLVVQARNDLQAAFAALSTAMGAPDAVVYELEEEPLPPDVPPNCAGLIADALKQRPDLAGQRLSERAAAKFADAERALWLPSISAVAVAGTTPYRQVGLTSRYSALGINFTMPIVNGGSLSARRAEAGLRTQAEEQRLRELENNAARDVRIAWLDAQASFRRLALTEQLEAHAADAADLAKARYDIGLGSIVELSQAQLNRTRAAIEHSSARYDYQIRIAALKYQTGTLK